MDKFNWWEKLEQFKIPIGLSIVGVVLIIGGIFTSGINRQKPKQNFPKESLIQNQKEFSVDVSGAVIKPGVYKLPDGSRIEDAITAAGGFSKEVNSEYVSKYLNMAQKLSDGSKIYVPAEGQEGNVVVGATVAGAKAAAKVNINTAGQSELETLSGIGPVTASRIISDRPYGAVEELLSKKVLSKGIFEKIKDQLVVY